LKKQLKEINGKYQDSCKENCTLQSDILVLKNSVEEIKHGHDLEIRTWKQKIDELDGKYRSQSKSLIDFKEKVDQLLSSSISDQQKYKNATKDLNGELENIQHSYLINEKQKDTLEIENVRLISNNQKLNEALVNIKDENRKLIKERGKLVKDLKDMQTPNDLDSKLGKLILF